MAYFLLSALRISAQMSFECSLISFRNGISWVDSSFPLKAAELSREVVIWCFFQTSLWRRTSTCSYEHHNETEKSRNEKTKKPVYSIYATGLRPTSFIHLIAHNTRYTCWGPHCSRWWLMTTTTFLHYLISTTNCIWSVFKVIIFSRCILF